MKAHPSKMYVCFFLPCPFFLLPKVNCLETNKIDLFWPLYWPDVSKLLTITEWNTDFFLKSRYTFFSLILFKHSLHTVFLSCQALCLISCLKCTSNRSTFLFFFPSGAKLVIWQVLMRHEHSGWQYHHTLPNFLFRDLYFAAAFYLCVFCQLWWAFALIWNIFLQKCNHVQIYIEHTD